MYKYANTRKNDKYLDWEMSRECRNVNGCDRRMATHGKLCMRLQKPEICKMCAKNVKKKNVKSEKTEPTCENEKK